MKKNKQYYIEKHKALLDDCELGAFSRAGLGFGMGNNSDSITEETLKIVAEMSGKLYDEWSTVETIVGYYLCRYRSYLKVWKQDLAKKEIQSRKEIKRNKKVTKILSKFWKEEHSTKTATSLLRKVKELPKLLWRDRKYVIVKVLAFVFFAWSIVDLFSYNGADQLEAEVRTAQSFISLLLLVTPSSVLFADDFEVQRSKRKEGEDSVL